jgi:hypothetical protein
LKASLEVMRDYARLRSEALPAFSRAMEAKESEKAARIEGEIRQKHGQWRHTIAGRQEWTLVERVFNPRAAARVE